MSKETEKIMLLAAGIVAAKAGSITIVEAVKQVKEAIKVAQAQ
jgi:hypothetical protein